MNCGLLAQRFIVRTASALCLICGPFSNYSRGELALAMPSADAHVTASADDGETMWLATDKHELFRIAGSDPPAPIKVDARIQSIGQIVCTKAGTWISTDSGVYQVIGGHTVGKAGSGSAQFARLLSVSDDVYALFGGQLNEVQGTELLPLETTDGAPIDTDTALFDILSARSGSFWLREPNALYRVQGKAVSNIDLSAARANGSRDGVFEVVGDATPWLRVEKTDPQTRAMEWVLYPIVGNQAKAVPPPGGNKPFPLSQPFSDWVVNLSGEWFHLGNAQFETPVLPSRPERRGYFAEQPPKIFNVCATGNDRIISSTWGIYRWHEGKVTPVSGLPPDQVANSVVTLADHAYVTMEGQAFEILDDTARPLKLPLATTAPASLTSIRGDDCMWFTVNGVLAQLQDDQIESTDLRVPDGARITVFGDHGRYWVETARNDNAGNQLSDLRYLQGRHATDVKFELLGETGSTEEVSYQDLFARLDGSRPYATPAALVNGRLWLAIGRNVYRAEGAHGALAFSNVDAGFAPLPGIGQPWVKSVGGATWFFLSNGSSREALRIDPVATMNVAVDNSSALSRAIARFGGGHLWVAGDIDLEVTRRLGNAGPVVLLEPSEYSVRMASDSEFAPAGIATFHLPTLRASLEPQPIGLAVRDRFGNTATFSSAKVVIPPLWAIPGVGAILSAVLVGVAIWFAPRNRTCHAVLMNPWLRNGASFGVFPIVASLSSAARRRVLLRYRLSLPTFPEFQGVHSAFVDPAEEFMSACRGHLAARQPTPLLIWGLSGAGKTWVLRWLALQSSGGRLLPAASAAVYIRLRDCGASGDAGGNPIEAEYLAALDRIGAFNDVELARWMLQQGGLLLLLDGLNEASADVRRAAIAFARHHSQRNRICLTSQQSDYENTEGFEKIRLAGFDDKAVYGVLLHRFGQEPGTQLFASFSPAQLALARNPQALNLSCDVLERTGVFPASESALYLELQSQIERWEQEHGEAGLFVSLQRRGFDSLCSNETFVELNQEFVESFVNYVIDMKLLRRTDGKIRYTHATVRSFLASGELARRAAFSNQRNLFGNETVELTGEWVSTAVLGATMNKSESIAQTLCIAAVEKSPSGARQMFAQIEQAAPELVRPWKQHFALTVLNREMELARSLSGSA